MPVINPTNIGTFTISNSTVTITSEMGFRVVAMKLVSGTVRYNGSLRLNGTGSDPFTLSANDPVTIGGDEPIGGLTIDATSGVVQVITRS